MKGLASHFIFWLCVVAHSAAGQTDRRDNLKVIDPNTYSEYTTSFPIARDTLNLYPDSVALRGTMVDFTLGVSCGFFCGCGTLKIRVDEKTFDWPFEYIYVAVPCLNQMTKKISDGKEWKLYELSLKDTRCYWSGVPMNKFATLGMPFYVMRQHRMK